MELDITQFFATAAPMDYSASVAEIGASAGQDTWRAACEDSPDFPILDDEEKREAFRAFVRDAGAWSDDEIAEWSANELNALCIQWIAGDIREAGLDCDSPDWDQYQQDSEAGHVAGRLFRADDGRVYFYIGS